MGNWFSNWYKNYWGSNITYIANGYQGEKDICLWFYTEYTSLESLQVSARLAMNPIFARSLEFSPEIKAVSKDRRHFYRVKFGTPYRYRRIYSMEYMTVFVKDAEGGEKCMCENMPVPSNRSYVIDKDGYVHESGCSGNIWTDCEGNYHKPKGTDDKSAQA